MKFDYILAIQLYMYVSTHRSAILALLAIIKEPLLFSFSPLMQMVSSIEMLAGSCTCGLSLQDNYNNLMLLSYIAS